MTDDSTLGAIVLAPGSRFLDRFEIGAPLAEDGLQRLYEAYDRRREENLAISVRPVVPGEHGFAATAP